MKVKNSPSSFLWDQLLIGFLCKISLNISWLYFFCQKFLELKIDIVFLIKDNLCIQKLRGIKSKKRKVASWLVCKFLILNNLQYLAAQTYTERWCMTWIWTGFGQPDSAQHNNTPPNLLGPRLSPRETVAEYFLLRSWPGHSHPTSLHFDTWNTTRETASLNWWNWYEMKFLGRSEST